MRRLVARDLGEARPTDDPSALFDLGHTAGSDVAAEKDAYVADAVDAANR